MENKRDPVKVRDLIKESINFNHGKLQVLMDEFRQSEPSLADVTYLLCAVQDLHSSLVKKLKNCISTKRVKK